MTSLYLARRSALNVLPPYSFHGSWGNPSVGAPWGDDWNVSSIDGAEAWQLGDGRGALGNDSNEVSAEVLAAVNRTVPSDVEISTNVRVNRPSSVGGIQLLVVCRWDGLQAANGNPLNAVVLQLNSSGTRLALSRAGSLTGLTPYAHATADGGNTLFSVKLRCVGDVFKAKIWDPATQPEPTWMLYSNRVLSDVGNNVGLGSLVTSNSATKYSTIESFNINVPIVQVAPHFLTTIRWFDASQLSFADNDAVDVWPNLSGKRSPGGWTAGISNPTAGSRPTFKTGQLNGLPIVRFDGVDDALRYQSSSGEYLEKPFTVYLVCRKTGSTGLNVVLDQGGLDDTSTRSSLALNRSGSVYGIKNGGAWDSNWQEGGSADTDWHVFAVKYSGADSTFEVDGELVPLTGTASTSTSYAPLTLGARRTNTNSYSEFFEGDVAEVVMVPSVLKHEDHVQVLNYLSDKWSVSVSVPAWDPFGFGGIQPVMGFWAEDPLWSNPGNGNPVDSVRNVRVASGVDDPSNTGTNRPTFRSATSAFNNKPTIEFDEASAQSLVSDISNISGSSFTIVLVGSMVDLNAEQTMLCVNAGTNRGFGLNASNAYRNRTATNVRTGGTNDGAPHIYRIQTTSTSANKLLWVDGVPVTLTGTDSSSPATQWFVLGSDGSSGAFMSGHIAFAAVYPGTVSNYETSVLGQHILNLERRLSLHYGIE